MSRSMLYKVAGFERELHVDRFRRALVNLQHATPQFERIRFVAIRHAE